MKKHNSIFSKLVISYIVFAFLIVISFVICLLIAIISISGGAPSSLSPYNIVSQEGVIENLNAITRIGGWIEQLDEEYNVIEVYGEKKTENKVYTQEEIYNLLSANTEKTDEYIGFMNVVPESNIYFLCIYNRNVMQVNPTVMLNAQGASETGKIDIIFLISFIVLFILNCILLSWYLSRKIKHPLKEITHAMECVQNGEEQVRLRLKTEAEFQQICQSFNMMIETIEQNKVEKKALEDKKHQMLLELSHDIKTPIATIKSYANALEAGLVPEDKIASYYKTIDRKADRVSQLTENMFLMLKMDSPEFPLQLERVDFCEFTRKICLEYYEEICEKGFEFDITISEESIMLLIDQRLLARVIGNLISNAMKYNETGHLIKLELSLYASVMQLKVMDDGKLIENSLRKVIFDPFVRGDSARKSDGGTGLGLSIVKSIVVRHGGSITCCEENGMNCFVMKLNSL